MGLAVPASALALPPADVQRRDVLLGERASGLPCCGWPFDPTRGQRPESEQPLQQPRVARSARWEASGRQPPTKNGDRGGDLQADVDATNDADMSRFGCLQG